MLICIENSGEALADLNAFFPVNHVFHVVIGGGGLASFQLCVCLSAAVVCCERLLLSAAYLQPVISEVDTLGVAFTGSYLWVVLFGTGLRQTKQTDYFLHILI